MEGVKTCFVFLVLCAIIGTYQCGRFGGGSTLDDDQINTNLDTSNVGLSLSRSARYLKTTPRHHVKTTARPRTTKRANRPTTPKRTTPKTTPRRVTTPKTTTRPRTTHKTTPRPTTQKPRTSHKTTIKTTTPRPTSRPTSKQTTHKPITRLTTYKTTTYKTTTKGPHIDIRYPITTIPTRKVTTRPTTRKPTTTPKKTTTYYPSKKTTTKKPKTTSKIRTNTATFDNLPPRPGSRDKSKPVKIKIVNKYNYHYPGYYTIPVPHDRYPGYFHTHSTYSYTSRDTGDGALGFYLGYKFAKMSTPTYNHETFFDGYRPRYDHYTVHHYYHNPEAIPPRQEIYPSNIIGCVGDSGEVCPANTTSVCTRNGQLMCMAPASSTVPCHNNLLCTKSLISCLNNTAPECSGKKNNTWIDIPCLSTAKIYGNIIIVNNTIIINNSSINNLTSIATNTSTNFTNLSTSATTLPPITLTSSGITEPTTSAYWKWKRQVVQPQYAPVAPPVQDMCVTVVALPAKRAETQGEVLFKEAKEMINHFFDSVWP